MPTGLSERVIYRELFPSGLTLLDKGQLGELGTSHLVARQELRGLLAGFNLRLPAVARRSRVRWRWPNRHDQMMKLLWLAVLATAWPAG